MFAAGFTGPRGFDVDVSVGGRPFRPVVEGLVVPSILLGVAILLFADFRPVRLVPLIPATHGVVGLQATVVALYLATHEYDGPLWAEDTVFIVAVMLMIVAALVTRRSLGETIRQWI